MNRKKNHGVSHQQFMDEEAFLELYDLYYGKVYSYALKICHAPELAADVTQDVFIKIWERGSLSDIKDMDAYFRIVTRNHVLKMIRRTLVDRKVIKVIQSEWEECDTATEDALALRDTGHFLADIVSKMPPQRRLVYRLCKEEGLQYAEVAQRMNLSTSSVKNHMLLALRFIREFFRKHGEQGLSVLLLGILLLFF